MDRPLADLSRHLLDDQERIITRWLKLCESDDQLQLVNRLTRWEFRNNIPAAIEGFCRKLACDHPETESEKASIQREVAKHGHHRWKQGFDLRQLIRDWGNLNQLLVSVIEDYFRGSASVDSEDRTLALERLAEYMTEATSASVKRFDELRRSEAMSLARDLKIAKEQFERLTEARGRMLREAAHDIRGGLSAIAGASAALKVQEDTTDSYEEFLGALDRGVNSVSEMLNSLLDLSRLESGADEVVLLSVNVGEILECLADEHRPLITEKGLELITSGPKEMLVRTDSEKVRRVAQNLLINAIQYTTRGEIELAWSIDDHSWILRVRDTGAGIQDILGSPVAQEMDDPDEVAHVESPLPSQAYRGEGIGLTIVRRLCSMLDAGVSLESELGKGTVFTIAFPLNDVEDETA